jgi:hypothetical protein
MIKAGLAKGTTTQAIMVKVLEVVYEPTSDGVFAGNLGNFAIISCYVHQQRTTRCSSYHGLSCMYSTLKTGKLMQANIKGSKTNARFLSTTKRKTRSFQRKPFRKTSGFLRENSHFSRSQLTHRRSESLSCRAMLYSAG